MRLHSGDFCVGAAFCRRPFLPPAGGREVA